MSKLTLSVDPKVVEDAKEFARVQGVSVSAMVETYLRSVVQQRDEEQAPPVLKAIRGSLRGGDLGDYRKYLEKKFGK